MDPQQLKNVNKTIWEHLSKAETTEQNVAKLINQLYQNFPNYDINNFVNPYLKLSLLHINSQFGRSNIVQGLFQQKPQVDIKDINDRTPLHYAAMSGNVDTIKVLIQNGANINAVTLGNETPLMKAAQFNQQKAVTFLLQHNANTNIKNSLNQTVSDILRISHPNLYQKMKQDFPNLIH
ncbi:hypothetical protein ABPG74_002857 [Tetrahymena malaccensis]